MRAPRVSCLRCVGTTLRELSDSTSEIEFFECPSCLRQYAKKNGGSLTYRWGHPISLALYAVMFSSRPLDSIPTVTESLVRDRSPAQVAELVAEIESELKNPTQPVSRIIEMVASESECREFLGALALKLQERVRASF
jgi:hypothetical protein